MKALLLFATAAFLVTAGGCRSTGSSPAGHGVIHPKVFQMTECWLSDTQQPVVTEVNLDAVARNRNQFDHDAVVTRGGWTGFRDAETGLFMRYKPLDPVGKALRVLFQCRDGKLTTESVITYRVFERPVTTRAGTKNTPVLSIQALQ